MRMVSHSMRTIQANLQVSKTAEVQFKSELQTIYDKIHKIYRKSQMVLRLSQTSEGLKDRLYGTFRFSGGSPVNKFDRKKRDYRLLRTIKLYLNCFIGQIKTLRHDSNLEIKTDMNGVINTAERASKSMEVMFFRKFICYGKNNLTWVLTFSVFDFKIKNNAMSFLS